MKNYRRIILALGLREEEDEILLKRAVDFAATFQAEILLVHAVEQELEYTLPYAKSKRQQTHSRRIQHARKQMQTLGGRYGIPITHQWIVEGPLDQSLLLLSFQLAVDLIIIGQSERHHLAEMLLGSISDRITKTAPCDVLSWRF